MSAPSESAERALVGIHQLAFDDVKSEREAQDRAIQMLCRALNVGRVIGFVGSGLAATYGQPSWTKFTNAVVEFTLKKQAKNEVNLTPQEETLLRTGLKHASRLSTNDRHLHLLGLCSESFLRKGRSEDLKDHMAKLIKKVDGHLVDWDRSDPLRLVIDHFQIRRFLTTNWDEEIEALAINELVCGPLQIDTRGAKASIDGRSLSLTALEYRLLAYLAHHQGRVVSRTELIEHLYDQNFDRDSNTIEVFVGRLRKKLGVDLIHTARGLGYRLSEPEDAD